MAVPDAIRWGCTHGLLRLSLSRRARSGNPDARLFVEPDAVHAPTALYEALRTAEPFAPGALGPVTVDHAVCTEILRHDDFGTVTFETAFPPLVSRFARRFGLLPVEGPADPPSMLVLDDPEHARYRRLVSRAFTAKAVAALRTRAEQVAIELLEGLEREADDGREVDIVARYAHLLPVTVISEMLGVPLAMRDQFLDWGEGAAASLDPGVTLAQYRRMESSLAGLDTWMRGHLRELRRDPGEDLLSTLIQATDDDGSTLTETELARTAVLILGAGFETTVNLIGNGTALLLDHPEQRESLGDDPERWARAVDEVLRFDPPVLRTVRRALRPTEVRGRHFERGEAVDLLLAAANRDPAVFEAPDVFDVTRANARAHMSFSSGIHYCLGAALARMEGEVALRTLFARYPDLALAGTPHRRPTRMLRGFDAMPVRLRAPVTR